MKAAPANSAARRLSLALAVTFAATAAVAADAERGQQLAEQHCSICHAVAETPSPPKVVADAPPFPVIARKHAFDAAKIGFAILAPHPKMNFTPAPDDAADIAAYVATLRR